jgi:anti-sigma B factor antagonist
MEFETEDRDPDVTVIRPRGRLTMVSAPAFRDFVSKTVSGRRPTLVVDLSNVEFMDSSGLGALVAGLKATRQAGGDLRIAAPNPQVEMVLQLTKLDRVLRPHASVDGAVDA